VTVRYFSRTVGLWWRWKMVTTDGQISRGSGWRSVRCWISSREVVVRETTQEHAATSQPRPGHSSMQLALTQALKSVQQRQAHHVDGAEPLP